MKIFVVGATGRIGRLLVEQLRQAGHEVFAGSRQASAGDDHAVAFDLHDQPQTLAKALRGMAAVYFVAGSRGRDLLQTDLNGAVNVMKAAELAGVKRFIQLSSAYDLQPERWSEGYLKGLTDYNIAKYFADDWLIHRTDLDYTILQPGVLTEAPATGLVSLDEETLGENPLADVATLLADLVDAPQTSRKVIMMKSGKTPIATALAAI
ncbi:MULTISPECIES: NAD(P)H-binding protein [Lactobacillaceae]|uniref:NAD(P)H-binding protein n=1 Tax=Lactobacillaceae TaxID=33958 RepID=UPI001456ACE7|nr:NAD(P)H-binding protein [Lactobacillus sp. HBUAS51381]NLR09372.1 SDR family oxidoreductase [Lactobacillus sp. HBUAS51381]